MPVTLGKTRVSSGRLLHENKISDWAFVELTNESATKFFRQNRMPYIQPTHMPEIYGLGLLPLPARVPLEEFGKLQKGRYYAKQGKTTGISGGVSNGGLTYCNWTERDPNHKARNRVLGCTEEHVIFSKKTGVACNYIQETFAEPGDAGSFIIDARSKVCGLLYGTMTGYCSVASSWPWGSTFGYVGAGLAMSMDDVLNSIKQRTASQDSEGNDPAILELP